MLVNFLLVLFTISSLAWCQDESLRRCARAGSVCRLASPSVEGPYYWNTTVRRDITEGKSGVPLRLVFAVLDTTTCAPISNALVDVWHCDAEGVYSHFIASSLQQTHTGTDNSTFLRGQQLTNVQGLAVFDTIYPGWYPNRCTHIHVKVHIGANLTLIDGAFHAKGGHTSHIGQVYFNDAFTDEVAKLPPYKSRNIRRTRNHEDFIYSELEEDPMMAPITFLASDGLQGPLRSEITLGINPKFTIP